MKALFQAFWPLAIIFVLALLTLDRGGMDTPNPLADQSLKNLVSVSRR